MNKKVLAFIFDLAKGGAQGVFVNVVNYLCECGVDIEVVVQTLDDAIYRKSISEKIKITDLGASNAKKTLPALVSFLKKNEFDVAVAFSPELAVNLYLSKKLLRRKYKILGRCINTLTNEYEHSTAFFRRHITSKLLRVFYHKIDLGIAQSRGMKEDLIANWGFCSDQVVEINNAMQLSYENEMKSQTSYKKKNYIMYAGRLEEQKGLSMLIEAFSMIENKDFDLKIIGSGSQKEELIALACKREVLDRIEFIDHTMDIMDYYRHATATVLTSYFEGFPNVLIESIACGTPVVAYDLPSGPKEIILEGQNGYLVPYLDVNAFAQAIDKAIETQWVTSIVKKSAERYLRENIMLEYMKAIEEI